LPAAQRLERLCALVPGELTGTDRKSGMLPVLLDPLNGAPLWLIGPVLLAVMAGAFFAGRRLRVRAVRRAAAADRTPDEGGDRDGFIISAVLGLLALLLGFTFSLAVQRFEERRELVVAEANAIGTAYLRAQILDSPHRERLSRLLVQHLDIELALAAEGFPTSGPLRAKSDRVLTDVWAATVAALDTPKSNTLGYVLTDAIDPVIDLDASRTEARAEQIPTRVFLILMIYLLSAACLLGYETEKGHATLIACFVLALMSLHPRVPGADGTVKGIACTTTAGRI
jgi:hypothetical protein